MFPVFLKLGPLTIWWYAIWIVVGLLAAYRLFRKRAERLGLSPQEAFNLILLLFWCGVLGARVYYVVLYWKEEFAGRWLEILLINHGGLVYFGGLASAVLTLILWARVKGKSLAALADALAGPLALAHAFGRLGCFMGGCCYGTKCDHFWAVQLQVPPAVAGIPVHPVQLYESFGLFYLVVALMVVEGMARFPGHVALTYGLLYSILRFIVEFFRGDVPHDVLGRFTVAQTLCAVLFFTCWLSSARMGYRASMAKKRVKLEQ